MLLHLLNTFPLVLTQPLVAHRSVESFDMGVLLGLTRLDVLQLYALLLGPSLNALADTEGSTVLRDDHGGRLIHRPSRAFETVSALFCQGLSNDLGFELLVHVDLAQPPALILQLFHPGHRGGVHVAVLGALFVKRRAADAKLSANAGHRHA